MPTDNTSSLPLRVVLSIGSAAVSETFTYPIDMTKTRLQLQGEMQSVNVGRKTAMEMVKHIWVKEGAKGLYRGWLPAILRHVPYSGIRIIVYEELRNMLGAKNGNTMSFPIQVVCGFVCGAIGQTVAVPMDLIKVRMQADGRLVAAGLIDKPRYSGLGDALRTIIKEEGVLGMWGGTAPAVFRAAMVNLGELATYDFSKQQILKSGIGDGITTHTIAAVISGFFATVASTPADVVKTRMMNQQKITHHQSHNTAGTAGAHAPPTPLYKGPIDCLIKTARTEGFFALYKGFVPTWARLGPWQLVFWVTYERLRYWAGTESF